MKWKLNLNIKQMQKKRSSSQNSRKKNPKKKSLPVKKPVCILCQPKCEMVILTQKSLYKKYSYHHLSEPMAIDKYITTPKPQKIETQKEYLQKYFKPLHRKHCLPRIKQVYRHHQEAPRLYMQGIRDIINKCYHRKRLLEYFRIAKILGIRVDTVKFSTFVVGFSKMEQEGNQKGKGKQGYRPIIGQISGYQFSEDVERQLIEILSNQKKQKNVNPEHEQREWPKIKDKQKDRETTCSFNNLKYKL